MTISVDPHTTPPRHKVTHDLFTTPWSFSSYANDRGPTCSHRPAVTSRSHGRGRSTTYTACFVRGLVPLWVQKAASHFRWRIRASALLNHRTSGPNRYNSDTFQRRSAFGVHMEMLDQAPSLPTFHQEGLCALPRSCGTRQPAALGWSEATRRSVLTEARSEDHGVSGDGAGKLDQQTNLSG